MDFQSRCTGVFHSQKEVNLTKTLLPVHNNYNVTAEKIRYETEAYYNTDNLINYSVIRLCDCIIFLFLLLSKKEPTH